MNFTIYTLNSRLINLIYLHKGFISVITTFAVQLDYSRGAASALHSSAHVGQFKMCVGLR